MMAQFCKNVRNVRALFGITRCS